MKKFALFSLVTISLLSAPTALAQDQAIDETLKKSCELLKSIQDQALVDLMERRRLTLLDLQLHGEYEMIRANKIASSLKISDATKRAITEYQGRRDEISRRHEGARRDHLLKTLDTIYKTVIRNSFASGTFLKSEVVRGTLVGPEGEEVEKRAIEQGIQDRGSSGPDLFVESGKVGVRLYWYGQGRNDGYSLGVDIDLLSGRVQLLSAELPDPKNENYISYSSTNADYEIQSIRRGENLPEDCKKILGNRIGLPAVSENKASGKTDRAVDESAAEGNARSASGTESVQPKK